MRPKTLLVNLLRAHGDVLDVGALLRAGQVFGIESGTIRVALSRLSSAGLVTQAKRGHWAMAPAATPLAGQVDTWRTLEALVRPWSGAWVGVATGDLAGSRAESRQRRRALDLLGFRALRPGLEIRPDNRTDDLRDRLAALRVVAPVFRVSELGPDQASAEALWDAHVLAEGYATHRDAIGSATVQMPHLPLADAARLSFTVGSAAIRALALDPLLPEELVDVEARRALGAEMREFDHRGRQVWQALLTLDEVMP